MEEEMIYLRALKPQAQVQAPSKAGSGLGRGQKVEGETPLGILRQLRQLPLWERPQD